MKKASYTYEDRMGAEAKANKKAKTAVELHCLFSVFILFCVGIHYHYMLHGSIGEKIWFIAIGLVLVVLEIYFIYQTVVHMEHYEELIKRDHRNGKED